MTFKWSRINKFWLKCFTIKSRRYQNSRGNAERFFQRSTTFSLHGSPECNQTIDITGNVQVEPFLKKSCLIRKRRFDFPLLFWERCDFILEHSPTLWNLFRFAWLSHAIFLDCTWISKQLSALPFFCIQIRLWLQRKNIFWFTFTCWERGGW